MAEKSKKNSSGILFVVGRDLVGGNVELTVFEGGKSASIQLSKAMARELATLLNPRRALNKS